MTFNVSPIQRGIQSRYTGGSNNIVLSLSHIIRYDIIDVGVSLRRHWEHTRSIPTPHGVSGINAPIFYPYYWAPTDSWIEKLLTRDIDPLHAAFLKAGAARVVVPVREEFDNAVLHFLETGEPWSGGELPEVTSPLYVDIVEEIKDRNLAPAGETAVGEPWEVELPTDLVELLQEGSPPPQWVRNEEGQYVLVPFELDAPEDDTGPGPIN